MRTFVVLAFALFAGESTLRADDSNVTTAASSAKLGAEFKAELSRHDRGLEKVKGFDPTATTSFAIANVRLKLTGNIAPTTEYKFRFNLLNPTTTPLDYGWVTHWYTEMMGLSVGKMKVLQGGWDNQDNNIYDYAQGPYSKNFAFSKYVDMVALTFKVAGKIQLQVFDDVVSTGTDGRWNKSKSLTWALGWAGKFGDIEPLVNLGVYDQQKSNWVDVGVKASVAGVNVRADVIQHTLNKKGTNSTTGKTEEQKNVASTMNLKVAYAVKEVATFSVYYSSYNLKDEPKDIKYNKYDATTKEYKWNDNGTTIAVGADLTGLAKGYTPFVAFISNTGKWQDPSDATKEESKSETWLKAGVVGEF